jgi:hypothetical protein
LALADPAITLAEFLRSPEVKGDTSAISQILKRPLSKDDVLSEDIVRHSFVYSLHTLMHLQKAYIQEVLLDLSLDGLKLAHVPILYQLFKVDIYSNTTIRPSLSRQSEKTGNLSQYTVVTPKVHALSMVLFLQSFKVVKPHKQALSMPSKCPLNMGEIHGALPVIKWIGSSSVSSVYGAVKIGKTIYKVWYLF